MKHKKTSAALFGLLMMLGYPAHTEENKTMAGVLPLCVEQPPGVEVFSGDTLISLSRRMTKPDAISSSEWIEFIYQKNQSIFIDNDRNRLPVGVAISFPCSEVEVKMASAEKPVTARLMSALQEMEAEIIQTRRLVEMQTEEIRQLAVATEGIRQSGENQIGASNVRAEPAGLFSIAVLGLTSLIALLFIVLSVYLYRWSRALSATTGQTLPKLETIKHLLRGIEVKIKTPETVSDDGAGDGISDVSDLRDYLKRLIPVDIAVDDFMQDGEDSKALEVIKALIEDALDSCGVETFSPEIGEDYRRAEGVADYPKTQVTDKPEDKFKITEVLEKGYRIKTETGYDVIYPARVRIFNTN